MKKRWSLLFVVCLVMVLGSCSWAYPRSRALVVVNDTTDQEVTFVQVAAFHTAARKMGYNALPVGDTLLPGERVTVHFSPSAREIYVDISSETIDGDVYDSASAYFLGRSITGNVWDDIEARYCFDGAAHAIEFGGPGYVPQEMD
jgi:hypothetical protein